MPNWNLVQPELDAGRAIIGVDEVGRGCWAGPVVAAAVMLPPGLVIDGVNDSKLVSATRRRQLDRLIRRHAVAVGLGWVAAREVDELGLGEAIRLSGLRALAALDVTGARIILDGTHNYLAATHDAVAIVKADSLVVPVAAASIVAKVARDRYMERQALVWPDYGFGQHKGYGTKRHQAGLATVGISPLHRRSFKPVQVYVHD